MGCTRVELHTRNPAAAAAIPPTNQTNFLMPCSRRLTLSIRRDILRMRWVARLGSGRCRAGCRYTEEAMDRVRFGRALGYGARHAAKTLMQAADAASTPSPARPAGAAPPSQPVQVQVVRGADSGGQTQRTVASATKQAGRLGRSVWTPLARFSSVVWLQVTGLFFALIAMFMAQGAWKERAAMKLPLASHEAVKFYALVAAFAVFAYFTISNFVRAYLRERRHSANGVR